MTLLRRHVIPVVAVLFAVAVGIALGGGLLGDADDAASSSEQPVRDDVAPSGSAEEPAPDEDAFADAFAAAAAPRLYDQALRGHPTAIVTMPGVDPEVLDAMVGQVSVAGGGLTGVFEVSAVAVDRDETTLVDTLTAQLMVQLGDTRIDPAATTYTRLGQLLSVAIATPVKGGQRPDASSDTIRTSLTAAELVAGDPGARLAPLVLVLLPESGDRDTEDALADAAVYTGLTTGLRANAAGVVVVGDTESGDAGLLAGLREDPVVTSTLATVDGGDTVTGQVTAMLALISSMDGSVGAHGASGSDGAVPIS